jgi:hypothetical protein
MSMEVLSCPHCGAPLPARALREVLECAYCGRTLVPGAAARWSDLAPDIEPPEGPYRGDGAERVRVGGRRFVVLGRVAEGDGCDVFFGRSDARLTELVLLKVARNRDAEAHLTRGWRALERLNQSEAQGAEFFSTLLPQLVSFGPLKDRDGRLCAVYRWRSGFVHTFDDVLTAHPGGVDGKAAVWLWKRTLELLGWMHRSGWVHGAVLPAHLLVNARDHGVVLAGWSAATPNAQSARERLPVCSASQREMYPEAQWDGAPATPRTDLTMAARSVLKVIGGDVASRRIPSATPAPLAALLEAYVDDRSTARSDDAWAVKDLVSAAGKAAYGPPRFHRLHMPGWR